MNSQDADNLLEQNLSGDPPSPAFRARVLRASTAAFIHTRRSGACWRLVALGTAATFIAAVSFLLGRASVPQPGTEPAVAKAGDTVAVPNELVAWVNAARLFKQLGMEDRAGRALDHAGRLMPAEAAGTVAGARPGFTGGEAAGARQEQRPEGANRPDRHESFARVNRIMAQYSGD